MFGQVSGYRRNGIVLAAIAIVTSLSLISQGMASTDQGGSASAQCGSSQIETADGCRKPAAVGQKLIEIAKEVKRSSRLQAVVARVDIAGRQVLRRGFGESQNGVRATPAMNFRIGSMTIPVLTSTAYRLHERGKLKLGAPLSRWFPGMPRSSEITLRMLMNNTSGYSDWVQGNESFIDALYADPFRIWTGSELLKAAFDRGFACDPGTCFNYAHTNFLILGRVLRKVGVGSLVAQMNRSILRPLGIRMAFSRLAPIPTPALAAYTSERGVFEQSTGWSPSWGLGNGMLATTSIDRVTSLARGVLSGRNLSSRSRRDLVRRYGPGFGPDPDATYYAQGLIVVNGWRRQNPFFNGYMGNVAWFPNRRIAVSLVATESLRTPPELEGNATDAILEEFGSYLTPSNSPVPPAPG